MQESKSQAPQLPPDVARYLSGPPPESQQFDATIIGGCCGIGPEHIAALRANLR